jgi:geranylgeranyl pyrophosphate synthase
MKPGTQGDTVLFGSRAEPLASTDARAAAREQSPENTKPSEPSVPRAPEAALRPIASALEPEARACSSLGIEPHHFERALFAGAREFLSRPGKAFRARLVETSFALAGGEPERLPRAALEAIELLHAGSLIVEDIQDDAEERRGSPALHRTLGMPRALNVGNWLYFVALDKLDELSFDPVRALETTRAANRCLLRCHEGQALDLTLRIAELKRAEVAAVALTTSQLKTGALMSFAARLGALAADVNSVEVETSTQAREQQMDVLGQFGEQTGVVLQMLDDLGSFVASPRQEKALEDLRGQRVNWVWAWAVECLDEVTYKQLSKQTARGENLPEVRQRLAHAVERLGRERIGLSLANALRSLEQVFGQRAAFLGISAELARLEQSYG